MAEPAVPSGASATARAQAWASLAARYAGTGERGRALVAARTALSLLARADADAALAHARGRVEELTGPEVVPLHVDMAGDQAQAAAAAGEARADWYGAPADRVLAMVGVLERDGGLEVVRVVVPGTRRGRQAFDVLVDALPPAVPLEVVLPARDPALLRTCRRAGFTEVQGSLDARRYVGGSLRVSRDGGGR